MKYVELSCKTNFSFLTGASHPEELVERAIEIGLSGLAITDKDGVYGIPKGFRKAKLHPDFKFIIGADLTIQGYGSLKLLARNRAGYGLMCRMLTASHASKPKGEAFLTWPEFEEFLARPQSEGLVGLVSVDGLSLGESGNFEKITVLKNVLAERLFLSHARYLDGRDKERTKRARELSVLYSVPVVATNDVHYHIKERRVLQDVVTSVHEAQALGDLGFKLFSNGERYLKTPGQMCELFSDWPEAIENTWRVAELCTFSPKELRYRYPSEWIPTPHTAQSYLDELVWRGAGVRYKGLVPEAVKAQLEHELGLIRQLEFADYFLTIFDIVEFAREKKILCQGRGSAANSVVCYVLGITAIDPVRMNLLFERFISVERGEPPDIDVDFEHERREEVIQYIYQKYGRDRAAMVSAVVTYQRRSAFREVAKAFGVPVGTLSARKVEKEFDRLTKDMTKSKNLKERITELGEELEGFPRHLSIHSGGFTLSADPIIEIVPVEPARMDGRTIIQWDKYDLDELGLLKVDVLSLGMLSALRKTLDQVGLTLYEIPQDDRPTYEMIHKADTVGVFQIESRAQMSMLGRLLPQNFYDLVIEVAIVRPGPIVGQMVHPYLRRRRGEEKVSFPHPKVRAILEKTLGVPLFQEQVMKLAIELADFSPGEADELRRSIAAWRSSRSIEAMGRRLIEGLVKSGLPRSFADQIFQQIQGFSEYGFPESHAASFALLAYASSYLKCHHPAEFTCALINSQPMGFYSVHTLVSDAVRHGVVVKPVSFTQSIWDCVLEQPNTVRLGFNMVKGLSRREADELMLERDCKSFSDFFDILRRSKVRRDVLSRMAMAGAFEEFGVKPRDALWALLDYELLVKTTVGEQLNIFRSQKYTPEKIADKFDELNEFQVIERDFDAFELSTHGHPMGALRERNLKLPRVTSKAIKQGRTGDHVKAAGLILLHQRPPTAKGVTFSTLEDEDGFLDLIFHPPVYEKFKDILLSHSFVTIEGRLQRDTNTHNIIVSRMTPISEQFDA